MIKSPNYTQIPNEYFDSIMKQLNGSENIIFLAIMRKTFGCNKEKDRISYSQIMELTGIKSKETISNSLKSLETKGFITIERTGQQCFYSVYKLT
ncbi:MAG: replication protein [Clostridia bacterium]|jgi:phage replication O-like protein O|nr:replication protein [Clostridia bacterium]